MHTAGNIIEERLKNLENHLEQENPVLLKVVQGFRNLDKVGYRLGLLEPEESYATHIPWWPLIAALGLFSSGKSTFINHYLGIKLQRTGNQAVDDKFTVICYSHNETPQTLPGVALDSDPRFPFYQFSKEIDEVAVGEGKRIDAYLQLKTCRSEALRGKILIDSPGFDADRQRTSTLRITKHIINLSDLVLVFFDARHPEPGAMHDTLEHLVANTIHRSDSEKFLYILNQLDTAAGEDNPEDVVAAWQRALAEKGLTAGRFYTIYNPKVAVPIPDESRRRRFETKRDVDLAEINTRMHQVEVQRAYRIVTSLEKTALDIKQRIVPLLREYLGRWKKRVLWGDGLIFGTLVVIALAWSFQAGAWQSDSSEESFFAGLAQGSVWSYLILAVIVIAALAIHFTVRRWVAQRLLRQLEKKTDEGLFRGNLKRAFAINTKPWRSIFRKNPAGWNRATRKQTEEVVLDTDRYVQMLNDTFTDPSGSTEAQRPSTPPEPAPATTQSEPVDASTREAASST